MALLALLGAASANAIILDWSTVAWTPGSLSNSYNVDPSNPGNDISVTLGGDTNKFKPDPTTGIQTPTIDSTMEGGMSPVQSSLDLAMKITTPNFISVTVAFSPQYVKGVDNVSFTIFGINMGTGVGTITNIYAVSIDGSTLIPATITGLGSNVQLSGSGFSQVLTGIGDSPNGGPGSGAGNATISFGSNQIESLTFRYENGTTGSWDSQIAVSNISFSPVPEINPAWSAVSACLGGAVLIFVRRRREPLA
jgi:hypothetical protein